jgi:protein PhnA
LAWRFLTRLETALWARELLEIAYLEPDILAWAQQTVVAAPVLVHRDSNGAILTQGDTVVLIKDLPVKGAGFTAKRGTAVRSISLVVDNEGHIEERVNAQRIVILTAFVKKSS